MVINKNKEDHLKEENERIENVLNVFEIVNEVVYKE
jgi:hypothetical protein